MGHRHLFTSSQMFESEHDQNWNPMQTDQTFGHMESSDNGPLFYPIESMFSDGINFSPHWNPLPRSSSSSSSQIPDAPPPFPPEVSVPAHDHPFQRHTVSSTGPFSTVPETYPSSSYGRRTFQGPEASFVDLTMSSNGGVPMPHHHQKRKSPGIPSSRYHHHHGAGSSSSELPMESCHEKAGLDSQPVMPWDCVAANPGYDRGNGLSIRAGGDSTRNVRSRSALDLESDRGYSLADQPTPMDILGQPSAGLTLEWSHFGTPPHVNNVLVSDSSGFSQDPTRFLLGNNDPRNSSIPQSYPSSSSARGVRSVYSQRPNASPSSGSRASSSSSLSQPGLRLGHPGPSEEGLHLRQARAFSSNSVGWRNGDRSGRSRISHAERYRLQSDETSHDRFASQGFMIVDRSSVAYGSSNTLDQHREMRLDVDNMSYEELLALGERIGTVSTGVSADMMPKCVTETIYCSSDQMQDEDEETCAICLEEYKHLDDVGTLKSCGHDYHVECIKKWLEMKNLCPICKRPALADDRLKGK